MAKNKIAYICTECGGQSTKWQGQCPHCFAWNTLVEEVIEGKTNNRFSSLTQSSSIQKLSEVETSEVHKRNTGISEFDRVLGGGFVLGGVILLGGDPGIGKSTLLQQIASNLPLDLTACYVTGEESINQVAQRSSRIGTSHSSVLVIAST